MNKIKKYFYIISDQALIGISTLYCTFVASNKMSISEFGRFTVLLSISYFLNALARSVFVTSIQPTISSQKSTDAEKTSSDAFEKTVLMAGVGLPVCFLSYWSPVLSDSFYIIISALGFTIRDLSRVSLVSQQKEDTSLLVNGASSLIFLFLVFLFGFFDCISPGVLLTLYFVSAVPAGMMMTKTALTSRPRLNLSFSSYLNAGGWLLGSVVIGSVGSRFLPWILNFIAGPEEVAKFGAMGVISGTLGPIVNAVTLYMVPVIVRESMISESQALKTTNRVFYAFSVLAVGYAIFGYLLCGLISRILLPREYGGLEMLLAVLCLTVGLKGSANVLTSYGRAKLLNIYEFRAQVMAAIVVLIISYPLIVNYGALGAGVSFLGGCAVSVIYSYFHVIYRLNEKR